MITKRDVISRGSCFCEKYNNNLLIKLFVKFVIRLLRAIAILSVSLSNTNIHKDGLSALTKP